jgi:hypothetical protein
MTDETPADEELTEVDTDAEATRDPDVDREADAAAKEAGQIGGRSGQEHLPESERAPAEAGGGVSEGFEQSEELLREQAQHGDSFADPLADRPAAEQPGGRDHGEYGEADSEKSSEDDDDAT